MVFQSGAGIDGGGAIPSTTKFLYRRFGFAMALGTRNPQAARDGLLISYIQSQPSPPGVDVLIGMDLLVRINMDWDGPSRWVALMY
jgi:hypothetical protein